MYKVQYSICNLADKEYHFIKYHKLTKDEYWKIKYLGANTLSNLKCI